MSRAIDADALIPMMKYATTDSEIGVFPIKIGFNDIEKVINEQPTIEPEPHWIPVSERLPERGKDVLVTRDYDGREDFNKSCRYVEVASSYGEEDAITWNSYSDEYKMTPKNHHVIAWMPLPEPYREDGE